MSELALKPYQIDLSTRQIGHSTRRNAKLTKTRRIAFLKEFAKDYNLTRAANFIGVTRKAIYDLIERDELFSAAFNEIDNAVLDQVESALITVAKQPTREGFNDRKLLLQSKRREIYGTNPEIQVNVQVNTIQATSELANLARQIPDDKK